jgi:heme O synthase-like polyprenyltransferase
MLPVVDATGVLTAHRAVSTALLLLPVCLLPAVFGVAAPGTYAPWAIALSAIYLAAAVHAGVSRTEKAWRRLLRVSFLHLTGVFLALILTRLPV